MKQLKLMKTLLVAVGLLAGVSNAWGVETVWKKYKSWTLTGLSSTELKEYSELEDRNNNGKTFNIKEGVSSFSVSNSESALYGLTFEGAFNGSVKGSFNTTSASAGNRGFTFGGGAAKITIPNLKAGQKVSVTFSGGAQKISSSQLDDIKLDGSTSYGTVKADGDVTIARSGSTCWVGSILVQTPVSMMSETYNFLAWAASGDAKITASDSKITNAISTELTVGTSVGVHGLNNRFAFCNISNGSSFGWRLRQDTRSGYGYQYGLYTQGKDPDWGPFYWSICNLKKDDKVTITWEKRANKDADPKFVSTNAKNGSTAVSVGDIMASGTTYIITADGQLDLVQNDNNCAIKSVVIVSEGTEVDEAIFDCKSVALSSDFDTYIDDLKDGGSLNSATEVYSAHTAWQIAQADAASSNDITKVIFDAGVSDISRWNKARSNSGQQYTGAPDVTYFDAWDEQASNASQTIYGLPAGTYTLKVATRSSATLNDVDKYNIWIWDGSATTKVLGSHIGNAGGNHGNGWNWTYISFTVASKANVSIGFYSLPGKDTDLWAGADDWHLYKGTLDASESVTVTVDGYATYASPYALDFTSTEIKAYTAKVDAEDNKVVLTQINQVPSNTPIILYKAGGKTEDVPVIGSATAVSADANDLIAGAGNAVASSEVRNETTYYNYILNNVSGIGFYKAANQTVATNRAYLQTTFNATAARAFTIVFDEESTGIQKIESAAANKENGAYYNLAGQRVAQPTKGLYIVNGKKVVIK